MNHTYTCDDCEYEKECSEHNGGPRREDGDDYTALIGTHLCKRSWDAFFNKKK